MVYVASSTIPGAGRGIFTRAPMKLGTVVAFYNGIKVKWYQTKGKGETSVSHYRMDNDWSAPNQILDIPLKWRSVFKKYFLLKK